jgi:hypothetical protein
MKTFETMKDHAMGWLKDHPSKFFLSLGSGIVCLVIVFYLAKYSGHSSYNDYLHANITFSKWIANFKEVPYHALFGKTSVLISNGDLKNALQEALSLKETMEKNEFLFKEYSILNIYNLMRIASLYRSLNMPNEELASLNELESYISLNIKALPSTTQNLLENSLKDKDITFFDYIHYRKSELSQG